jgi:hypothetical protein
LSARRPISQLGASSFWPHLRQMPPNFCRPTSCPFTLEAPDLCHPILSHVPFTRNGWPFELKHDGFRALARTGSCAQLLSRSGRSMAEPFPEIVTALARLPDGLVLDGELVVPGRSDVRSVLAASVLAAAVIFAPATVARTSSGHPYSNAAAPGVERDAHGKIARDPHAKEAFRQVESVSRDRQDGTKRCFEPFASVSRCLRGRANR